MLLSFFLATGAFADERHPLIVPPETWPGRAEP